MSVRVRFAPSPTGMLHIGGLRTALFNYLFAKHHNGTFVLRIEDTDQTRYVADAENDIISALRWSGLDYDEGPGKEGEFGPYRQSERKATGMYKQYADQLVEAGNAYYAFDTPESIEEMKERLRSSGNPSPKYDAITRMSMKNSLTLPKDEVAQRLASGEAYVIRLKVPRRETIKFEDEIRGNVSFESQGLDDQVLLKSDGMPTYHLANVVDDHLMQITHVIRGEEWLSSAPKHILLYQYLGWEAPKMAHLPLIMSPNGGKLSKRKAETEGIPINSNDYDELNYEPQALVNFLAFLGWSPGTDQELFSMQELIDAFTLARVSKSGSVFNPKKLLWYNEQYLRNQPNTETLSRIRKLDTEGVYSKATDEFMLTAIEMMHERASIVTDYLTNGIYFVQDPTEIDEKSLKKAWKQDTPALLDAYIANVEKLAGGEWNATTLKAALVAVVEENGVGMGKVMMPVRLALTGVGFGPDLFQLQELLGSESVIRRLKNMANLVGEA
jgi:glutamyl-tRNA synthetase